MTSTFAWQRNAAYVALAALGAAAIVAGSAAAPASATSVDVSSEAEWRDALDQLSADDSGPHTINITADFTISDAGQLGDPFYDGDEDLTVNGNGHTVSYEQVEASRFLYVDTHSGVDIVINDLAVEDFDALGAVYVEYTGNFTVNNSHFTGNAGYAGGAINADAEHGIAIVDSTFTSNEAVDVGGALHLDFGDVQITGSTFTENVALGDGGAIFAYDDLSILDSVFVDNTVDDDGGAIFSHSDVAAEGSTFSGNIAEWGDGGALYVGRHAVLADTSFVENSSGDEGGAVFLGDSGSSSDVSTITGSVFDSNDANDYGGAVYVDYSELSVTDSVFTANTSEYAGGAIYSEYEDVHIDDSHFEGNASDDDGGAVKSYGPLSVSTSTFVDNTASEDGGAIDAGGDATVTGSHFSGNASDEAGGAVYVDDHAVIESSTFVDNTSASYGGALYAENAASVVNSTFIGNHADAEGGAVFHDDEDDSLEFLHVTMAENSAPEGAHVWTYEGFVADASVFADAARSDGCHISEGSASGSYNIDDDGTCAASEDGTDGNTGFGVDAQLGEVADNGGPTLTVEPAATSPAVDLVPFKDCATNVDQRGFHRPRNGACDAGAVELLLPPFPDVPLSHPFVQEIDWLKGSGVTGGYADGNFKPRGVISRQAMAAFLYRFAGEPEFDAPATASFSDVPTSHAFYDEIEWLASTGITTGYGDGTFRPSSTVSRQAMAAFLYRFADEPAFTPPGSASFDDVPTGHAFFSEIEWLANTGITNGYDDLTFRGTSSVSRQAMGAFLYRYDTQFG